MEYHDIEGLITHIESLGYSWDVGMVGTGMYEARIWDWPNVIGRYRTTERKSAVDMLIEAMKDANALPEPLIMGINERVSN